MNKNIKVGDVFESIKFPKNKILVKKINNTIIHIKIISHRNEKYIGELCAISNYDLEVNWKLIVKICYPDE